MAKTWIITGISSGLGEAMADAALARGDTVYGVARGADVVAAFDAREPGRSHGLLADMTDRDAVFAAIGGAVEKSGGIDILVNNAGRVLMSYVEEADPQAVRDLFEVNLMGPLHAIQAVLPSMRARGQGHIVNISSGGGILGVPGVGMYSSSKFALEGMSEALAPEVKGLGIHVTIVEPGAFRTKLLDNRDTISTAIPEYGNTSGGQFRSRLEGLGGTEDGDPAKLAQAMLQLVDSEKPPLRLPLNDDAVQMVETKAKQMLRDVEAWKHISTGLSFA